MHLLSDNDEPICEKPKTATEDPNRAHDRKDMEAPKHMPYKTDRDEPKRA